MRFITKSIPIALSVSLFTSSISLAAQPNQVTEPLPNKGTSSLTLSVTPDGGSGGDSSDIVIATVPAELPIVMDLEGNITVPTNAKIINHSLTKGIQVTKIDTKLDNGWTPVDFNDDFSVKTLDTKEIGLQFRGDNMTTAGDFTLSQDNWKIPKDSSIPLNMKAKLPKQSESSKTKIASIDFTIDWSGDNSSGGDTPQPPDSQIVNVKFVADENGMLEGNTETEVNAGEPVTQFPTPKPASIRYEFSNWVDSVSNSEVTPSTPITSDTVIKARFKLRAEHPKNWFTTDGKNTITGLSDEYLNMIDAPTDLVIPSNIGGSTITTIGNSAFANKDLITSVVVPDTVTTISNNAFTGCDSITQLNLDYAAPTSIKGYLFGLSEDRVKYAEREEWDINPMSLEKASQWYVIKLNNSEATIESHKYPSGDVILPSSVNNVRVTNVKFSAIRWTDMTSLTIPGSYKSLGQRCFEENRSLTNIVIMPGVETIEAAAFDGCIGVTELVVPDTVTEIGGNAFKGIRHVINYSSALPPEDNPRWGALFLTNKTS